MRTPTTWLTVMAALCCALPSWAAEADPAEAQTGVTKRVYLMGSSLTDQVNYSGLQKLAESRGHKHIWGRHGIPGAPISWIWSHKEDKRGSGPFYASGHALKEFQWDVVTIEPRAGYEGDLKAACSYIDYTLPKSPEVQFYVFAQWPRIHRGAYDRQWLENAKDIQNNIRLGFEEFLKDLRAKYADIPNPPLMIPVGHAMHLLELKIRAGLVPVMTSIFDGYSDASHQNHLGEYIVGCTFFATIYGETPVGLPTEPYGDVPADLARVIQETVWEAVNAHPLSGVTAEGEFRIITPWFPDAIQGEPFSRELHSAFGRGAVTWSLEAGSLPPGITVDPQGLLTGTAGGTGAYSFTVKAVDAAGNEALRELSLACVPESVPEIPEPDLTTISRGAFVKYPLAVQGGNGDITWRLTGSWRKEGTGADAVWKKRRRPYAMIPGMELTLGGLVIGSPAQEGVSKLRLRATDSDPTQPDVAEREWIVTVGPAGDGVCLAPPVDPRPNMDGTLDEPYWDLNNVVAKTVRGKPTCSARFGAVYNKGGIYIAVEVADESIHADEGEAWERDGIEIYFDRANDHEKEYNTGDYRIVCPVSGDMYTYNIPERKGANCTIKRTDTGYTAEIVIALGGILKANRVYGLDVAINDNDGDGTGQIVWHGTADNATDPSNIGTVILLEPEAAE